MAIYHLCAKAISRSAGRSIVAAAAYRAGAKIRDARTGETYDYRAKKGVICRHIVCPQAAPAWARSRAALWNAAEAAERRKDACVGREVEISLPAELSPEKREALALRFARHISRELGCAVDVCLHDAPEEGDARNFHAHLLLTERALTAAGFAPKKARHWNREHGSQTTEKLRAAWEEMANAALLQHGCKIDRRSNKARGIHKPPTTHAGPALTALARKSEKLQNQIAAIDAAVYASPLAPPTPAPKPAPKKPEPVFVDDWWSAENRRKREAEELLRRLKERKLRHDPKPPRPTI